LRPFALFVLFVDKKEHAPPHRRRMQAFDLAPGGLKPLGAQAYL
jgi:hypothetical protein